MFHTAAEINLRCVNFCSSWVATLCLVNGLIIAQINLILIDKLFSLFQSSGIKLDAECKDMFAKIKDKKLHGYAIMMINQEKTAIILEQKGLKLEDREVSTTQTSFDEMRKIVLTSQQPRYILADVTYERHSGVGKKDVVVYIYW